MINTSKALIFFSNQFACSFSVCFGVFQNPLYFGISISTHSIDFKRCIWWKSVSFSCPVPILRSNHFLYSRNVLHICVLLANLASFATMFFFFVLFLLSPPHLTYLGELSISVYISLPHCFRQLHNAPFHFVM